MKRNIALALAVAGLATAPVGAAIVREAAPISGQSELSGQGTPFFLAGIAIIALAVIFLPEDSPASP